MTDETLDAGFRLPTANTGVETRTVVSERSLGHRHHTDRYL